MSLCAASARAFSVTGSSSAIADRNWAMILSLACTSFHKCLFSLASDVDSKDEQVEVLSPRWLCRMVAADCRLYTRHEKEQIEFFRFAAVSRPLVNSVTYLAVLLLRHVQLLRATQGFIWTLSESRSRSLMSSDDNSASPKSSPWPESRHSNSSLSLENSPLRL
jgi:hypothetical protein